jgi:hypothetical protein
MKRQQGINDGSKAFRQALSNLRMNRVTMDDWELLSSRVQHKVLQCGEDLTSFKTLSTSINIMRRCTLTIISVFVNSTTLCSRFELPIVVMEPPMPLLKRRITFSDRSTRLLTVALCSLKMYGQITHFLMALLVYYEMLFGRLAMILQSIHHSLCSLHLTTTKDLSYCWIHTLVRSSSPSSASRNCVHSTVNCVRTQFPIMLAYVTAPTWPFTEPLDPGGWAITTGTCMY